MTINDKHDVLTRIRSMDRVVLELGCGARKRVSESIGVDGLDYECVDIVGDIFEVLASVPDASVDLVSSYHVFEHLPEMSHLMQELGRVLKPGGRLSFVVPHFSNPYYYSDCTHRSFFGLYTLSYFSKDQLFQRKVPTYQRDLVFELTDVRLGFKSTPPFFLRHGWKRVCGLIFNASRYMQELYEENFCYWVPCYEISFELRKPLNLS